MKAITVSLIAFTLMLFLATPQSIAAQHHHGDHHQQPEAENVHPGKGIVHSVDPENATIRMQHEPIPSLRWPEMVMDLKVKDGKMLEGLQEGDRIAFDLMQTKQGFVITHIERE